MSSACWWATARSALLGPCLSAARSICWMMRLAASTALVMLEGEGVTVSGHLRCAEEEAFDLASEGSTGQGVEVVDCAP